MSPASKSGGRPQSKVDQDRRFGLPVQNVEVFAPFAAWMDGELEKLVDRWIHLASPNAGRHERALLNRR